MPRQPPRRLGQVVFCIVGGIAVLVGGLAIGISGFSLCQHTCPIDALGRIFTVLGLCAWLGLLVGRPTRRLDPRTGWYWVTLAFVLIVVATVTLLIAIQDCHDIPGGACF